MDTLTNQPGEYCNDYKNTKTNRLADNTQTFCRHSIKRMLGSRHKTINIRYFDDCSGAASTPVRRREVNGKSAKDFRLFPAQLFIPFSSMTD
ncbi:hypothetical protein LGM46_03155 [Burkholderia arboris]|uniref:hypothetical protein n=1 Tax=Burkholderia arboris TaxID=488730 RepID=UPI001CF35F1E|nr:hypothetical protein [Burkholderia arboris]MCA8031965.1 hypothetical protein [Burkholderia arboris]